MAIVDSLLGGVVKGSAQSGAQQTASVNFFVPAGVQDTPPLVSPYAAGQGLSTINAAYPDSAAFGASATTATGGSSLLILAALAAATYFFLVRK